MQYDSTKVYREEFDFDNVTIKFEGKRKKEDTIYLLFRDSFDDTLSLFINEKQICKKYFKTNYSIDFCIDDFGIMEIMHPVSKEKQYLTILSKRLKPVSFELVKGYRTLEISVNKRETKDEKWEFFFVNRKEILILE